MSEPLIIQERDLGAWWDALRSAGREGALETAPTYGPTTDFTNDIILVNGQFVQWPDGQQK